MNRLYLVIFSFLFILFTQIPVVKHKLLDYFLDVKREFFTFEKRVSEKLRYFSDQSQKIESLEEKEKKLRDELANYEAFYAKCKNLIYFKKINKPNLVFTQVISYAALPDFSKIYIDYDKKISTPKGLVYDNEAAGIVVKNFGKYSLALLNSNPKTSYTVLIGKKKIPGIFYGKINEVKYIKKYQKINVGDLVVTSGLDGIFYRGALVGRVTEVKQKKLYQVAKVKLFYDNLAPEYFYVVDKNVTINEGGENERKRN